MEKKLLIKKKLSTMKDRLPKEQGNLSFLHLLGSNCVNLKIVI